MTTADLVRAYEPQARHIPGLPAVIQCVDTTATDTPTGLRAELVGGIGYIYCAESYTVTARSALHEFGHLKHFMDRSIQDPFWAWRFGGCVTAPKSWAEAYLDAHPAGAEIWMALPGETFAECFAVAIEGTGKERTLDYGCAIDPQSARTFFGFAPTLPPPQKDPIIEWLGPAAPGNFLVGRQGNPVSLIIDHWTTGSLTSALQHFKTQGTQVSAHYIVGLDGRIVQVVQETDTAYQAGNFQVNLNSIGIEHEAGPVLPPTDKLYAASAWLHRQIADRYHIALETGVTVKRHNQIVATTCPGTLDVARLVEEAEDLAFTDADRVMLTRVRDILEAREAQVWTQRLQEWLSKALKSIPQYARPTDYTGPDVTTGNPRT